MQFLLNKKETILLKVILSLFEFIRFWKNSKDIFVILSRCNEKINYKKIIKIINKNYKNIKKYTTT